MTKKIFAAVVAVMMVMALSVTAFANISLLDAVSGEQNANAVVAIPEGVDVSDGATVTIKAKGTSANETVRFYLAKSTDNGTRVTDIGMVEVVDGAFDVTFDLAISYSLFEGNSAPDAIQIKGKAWDDPLTGTTFEVLEFVTADGEAAPAPEASAPEATTPAETTTPEPAKTENTAPSAPKTGLALAVVPAVMALAAVAVSKKH